MGTATNPLNPSRRTHPLNFPPIDWPDIELDDVWIDVLIEEGFDVSWPPPPDPIEKNVSNEEEEEEEEDPPELVRVEGPEVDDVKFDLEGVRGKYKQRALFEPTVSFSYHPRYTPQKQSYLYNYLADLNPFLSATYTLIYDDEQEKSCIIRIWQDYNLGKTWIGARLAYEKARDALWEQGLPLPPEPPHSPCPP